ncbi:MAG: methyltransferase [Candidatus Binataceae bacterium]
MNSASTSECPFRLDQCPDLGLLREAFKAAGVTQAGLEKTGHPANTDISILLRRTTEPTAYNTLARLFRMARTVPLETARVALAGAKVDDLVALGLLELKDGQVRSIAAIDLGGDLLIAHDYGREVTAHPIGSDFVLGLSPAGNTMAHMTVRRTRERMLDLGVGSGIQSLVAAQHAAHIIGVDINPRALNFAALNTRLNGITSIELRQGSLYEPVEGERFDLIIANPPYVVSPESRYSYRDSGLGGDAISQLVIRGAPAHLNEDGYCVVLCNWSHTNEEDWAERPLQWLRETGCDAWLLQFGSNDPLTYASRWLFATEGYDSKQYGGAIDEWMAYYEKAGIGAISHGAVVLRRRSGHKPWLRADSIPSRWRAVGCSDQIKRIFAAQDMLHESGDSGAKLLDRALVLEPDHELIHALHMENGNWVVANAALRQSAGFQFSGEVDAAVATVLAGCDGRHTLRTLFIELAKRLKLDFEPVAREGMKAIRTLMQAGFFSIADNNARGAAGDVL